MKIYQLYTSLIFVFCFIFACYLLINWLNTVQLHDLFSTLQSVKNKNREAEEEPLPSLTGRGGHSQNLSLPDPSHSPSEHLFIYWNWYICVHSHRPITLHTTVSIICTVQLLHYCAILHYCIYFHVLLPFAQLYISCNINVVCILMHSRQGCNRKYVINAGHCGWQYVNTRKNEEEHRCMRSVFEKVMRACCRFNVCNVSVS